MDKLKIQTTPSLESHIKAFNNYKLVYQDQVYHVQKEVHDMNQRDAVLFSTIPTIIHTLIFFIALSTSGKAVTPLIGNFSIAGLSILIAVIGSFIVFTTAFFMGRRRHLPYIEYLPPRHYPALMIAVLIVVIVTLMFLFYLLDKLFYGLTLDAYLASTLAAAIFTVVNYFCPLLSSPSPLPG